MTSKTCFDVVVGNGLVEKVAHRVDEDHPRPLPAQRLLKPLGPEPEIEALLVGVPSDPRQRSANVSA